MTRMPVLLTVMLGLFLIRCGEPATAPRYFYEIKIYRLAGEQQELRVDHFLEHAYLPALHRAGIGSAGVFKPVGEDTTSGNIIVVFIPYRSLEQYERLPELLQDDATFRAKGQQYLMAPHDDPPYERIESILLKSFRDMPRYEIPEHDTPPGERVYELRSYQSATEEIFRRKVEMFNEGGEMALFEKLDFQAVFYAEVIAGKEMPNLMYMTTFRNMEARNEHWEAFRVHPEWEAMKGLERYRNTVSHIDIFFLHPASYSDI